MLAQPYTADRQHVADTVDQVIEWIDEATKEGVCDAALGYQKFLDQKFAAQQLWERQMAEVDQDERTMRLEFIARREKIHLEWAKRKERLDDEYKIFREALPAVRKRKLEDLEKLRKEREEEELVKRMRESWIERDAREAKKAEAGMVVDQVGPGVNPERKNRWKSDVKSEGTNEEARDLPEFDEEEAAVDVVPKVEKQVKVEVKVEGAARSSFARKIPEVRRMYFDAPGSLGKVWAMQSKWTENKESQIIKKYDGVKMWVGPREEHDKRSAVTLRLVGIPQNKSRVEIFEAVELMAQTGGMIQALYIKVECDEDEGFSKYLGHGFVHVASAEVADTMLMHGGVNMGMRNLRCDFSNWEFDMAAAAKDLQTEVFGFGGPRFSFNGDRRVFLNPEDDWAVPPYEWRMNREYRGKKEWMRYLGKDDKIDWRDVGPISVESPVEEAAPVELGSGGSEGENPFRSLDGCGESW